MLTLVINQESKNSKHFRGEATHMDKLQQIAASISDAELEILKQLWKRAPLTAQEIIDSLQHAGDDGSHPKTVKTLINRLLNKGALSFEERNRKYYYSPAIDSELFYSTKTAGFLDKFFNGEITPLVSFFSRQNKLDEKDLAELKQLIAKLEADDE
jgi:BlaI family transcriptional regulator, penicillinase repressor